MPASRLEHGSNYHLFKAGIEPKWEDSANTRGGQWVVTFSNKQRKEKLDKLWLYTVRILLPLCCLACIFNTDDTVTQPLPLLSPRSLPASVRRSKRKRRCAVVL